MEVNLSRYRVVLLGVLVVVVLMGVWQYYYNLQRGPENQSTEPIKKYGWRVGDIPLQETELFKENQTYLVVFKENRSEDINQVLSIEGVKYLADATAYTPKGPVGNPSIIISAESTAIEEIKKFNFILDVQSLQTVEPKSRRE